MDFSDIITLTKNKRGVYDFDTIKGCYYGMLSNPNGCYGECYAARYSKRYGYNFKKSVVRKFKGLKHLELIRDQIMNIDMPFIRIGVAGDPSENWKHTISVIKLIYGCKKDIVIITKHWKPLTDIQLMELSKFNVCINTSVSALDNPKLLQYRLKQYNRIKLYCNSVLRIVSCKFNKLNLTGMWLNDLQNNLFNNDNVIDTILRVSKNNKYVLNDIIIIKKVKFLNSICYASKCNENTYFGYCKNCPELCGINKNKLAYC